MPCEEWQLQLWPQISIHVYTPPHSRVCVCVCVLGHVLPKARVFVLVLKQFISGQGQ